MKKGFPLRDRTAVLARSPKQQSFSPDRGKLQCKTIEISVAYTSTFATPPLFYTILNNNKKEYNVNILKTTLVINLCFIKNIWFKNAASGKCRQLSFICGTLFKAQVIKCFTEQ